MKGSFSVVAAMIVAALPLWACQSVNAGQAADSGSTREITIAGQNSGSQVVAVPVDRSSADAQAPYALRGDQQQTTVNVDAYRRLGTNGS